MHAFCQIVEVFPRDHSICSHYRGIQIKGVQISEAFTVIGQWASSSAVLKEFFEGILYHHKRNHKQLSRGVGILGRSSWKICLAFKVP